MNRGIEKDEVPEHFMNKHVHPLNNQEDIERQLENDGDALDT